GPIWSAMVKVDPPLPIRPVRYTLAMPFLTVTLLKPVAFVATNRSTCAFSAWVGPANRRCSAPRAVAGGITGRHTGVVKGVRPVAWFLLLRKYVRTGTVRYGVAMSTTTRLGRLSV